jgi:transitional endoplasmic reticulum ATPase
VSPDRVGGLRRALEQAPENHALRLLLAETLEREGDAAQAAEQYAVLLELGQLPPESLVGAGWTALEAERLDLADRLAAAAESAGLDEAGPLRAEVESRRESEEPVLELVPLAVDADPPREWAPLEPEETVTFDEIGGLADVKKTISRAIILPFQRPDLYERYGRRAGGGVLLYGPPGVGKTLLARATAGECGLPFFNVRIEEILDPYLGRSERNLHDAFEHARANAPCVLFVDELDALAFSRRRHVGSAARPLVDMLLQELDAIGATNDNLLVLAATNVPWDVDEGLKRPGRFDRLVFVPPPDEEARRAILEIHLRGRPAERLDLRSLAKRTPLFSGADLRALVERAVDQVIDAALDAGEELPVTDAHLDHALAGMRPSTLDWLSTARNYVEFANHGGLYDDVASFLKTREAKSFRS